MTKVFIPVKNKKGEIKSFTVDYDDYIKFVQSGYKWHIHKKYVRRKKGNSHEYLARLIMGNPSNLVIDHIDGNTLNNCKTNLRVATRAQNNMNSRKQINNTSGYKGVSYHKISNKWRAQISIQGKVLYIGSFASPELAHQAYKTASLQYHGKFGKTD